MKADPQLAVSAGPSFANSLIPKKITFDGNRFQTTWLNEGARLIYTLNEGLSKNKNGQSEELSALSNPVTRAGFKPIRKCLVYKGFQRTTINYSPNNSLCNFHYKYTEILFFAGKIFYLVPTHPSLHKLNRHFLHVGEPDILEAKGWVKCFKYH